MTIDDEKSIYVGGLPFHCSEDVVRRAFDVFGAIVAVKIVHEAGKCYGFVTFTNPRAAVDAIRDMNGTRIAGHVVKVNDVTTRGRRPLINRGDNHRDAQKNLDWDRDRHPHRERQDHYSGRSIERPRDRGREWDTERPRVHGRSKDRFPDEVRDENRDKENSEKEWGRKRDRDSGRSVNQDLVREREPDRTNDHERSDKHEDKDQQPMNQTGSRRSREVSSNSGENPQDQVKGELELSLEKYKENLQDEISEIQGKLDEKEGYVSVLHKKSQKLEDALATAKKLSSQKRVQLTKFERCILQVNEYKAKLKSSEQELQSLVDTFMLEGDGVEDDGMVVCT
ncbi:hypothetical protein ACHQM5_002409 [Ranunculus cassubicifolius]